MERAASRNRLAITGFGILSPIGIGWEQFRSSVINESSGNLVQLNEEYPFPTAYRVSDFDPSVWLGKKGHRHFDRQTVMSLCATHLALENAQFMINPENEIEIGVVMGTSMGSIEMVTEIGRETHTQDTPYHISSLKSPLSVMNGIASSQALWFKARGLNATISAGRLTGLSSLRYAKTALVNNRSIRLLVGSSEYISPASSWIHYHEEVSLGSNHNMKNFILGEGVAISLIEKEEALAKGDRTPIAELIDVITGFSAGTTRDFSASVEQQGEYLAKMIDKILVENNISPEEIRVIGTSHQSAYHGDLIFKNAINRVFREKSESMTTVDIVRQIGECYSSSGTMQLAAVVSRLTCDDIPEGSIGLLTSVDPIGGIGCGLIRSGWSV